MAESELDQLLNEPAVSYPPPRRAPGGALVTVLLLLLFVLPFLGWASLSLLGLDSQRYTSALVALTQYAVPVGVVLVVFTLALRRWVMALIVGVVTALLVCWVAPRAIPSSAAPPKGTTVRILASNQFLGQADPVRIVDLVRSNNIDVLSLEELTPQQVSALDRAGLRKLLPYRVFHAGSGGSGTGIASRYPMRELSLMPRTTMHQPSAHIDLPGSRGIDFVAVHPQVPVGQDTVAKWKREIAALPKPIGDDGRSPRVLAGDFNSTLDHTPLRRKLGHGYEDAAEATGGGLQPTWPLGSQVPPFVTLDHVLAGGRIGIQDYRTFDVNGTDHRAILAQLVVP